MTLEAIICGAVAFGFVWTHGLAFLDYVERARANGGTGDKYHGPWFERRNRLGDN